MRLIRNTALILLLSSVALFAQKLEKLPALSDASVPKAVTAELQPEGARVLTASGDPLAEIWLRKSVPAAAAGTADEGSAYPQLGPSTFVGVVGFPKGSKDYRGHAIKPGFYTMRHEVMPSDGNHLGAAPNPDMVLLAPVADDPDPNAAFNLKEMVALSGKASGIKHAAVYELLVPESAGPRAYESADGYIVYSGTIKASDGKPFAVDLVVKGQAEQ